MKKLLLTTDELAASDSLGRPVSEFERWTGPAVDGRLIAAAEAKLGVRLPPAYLDLLRIQNGGFLPREIFEDENGNEISLRGIAGIGYPYGINSDEPAGGIYTCREWGYPENMLYLDGDGHTGVLLDYRTSGPDGEPSVVWVDVEDEEDLQVTTIARDFSHFLATVMSALDAADG